MAAKGDGEPFPHHHEVFSAEKAGHLDTRLRRLLYRPEHIAERYIRPGDHVLDVGCGPGFYTREFARRVGETGLVIAVDLQEEMLRLLRDNLKKEGLLSRIQTHQSAPDTLGLSPDLEGTIDVAFAIFVVHEVPDPRKLVRQISSLLRPQGRLYYSEPSFVVSGREFRSYLVLAKEAGLMLEDRRFLFLSRAAVLRKTPARV